MAHISRDKKNKSSIESPVSTLAVNLRKLMDLANISEGELSRRTNVKQPIIHRILSGENKNPKLLTLKPLAQYFLISISQLIGEQNIQQVWKGYTSKNHHGFSEILIVNWNIAQLNNSKKLPKSIITECKTSKEAFALYVLDDNNYEPLLPKNCIVIVDPKIEPTNGSQIVIKTESGDLIIRLFYVTNVGKFIAALSGKPDTITKISSKDKMLGTVIRTIFDH